MTYLSHIYYGNARLIDPQHMQMQILAISEDLISDSQQWQQYVQAKLVLFNTASRESLDYWEINKDFKALGVFTISGMEPYVLAIAVLRYAHFGNPKSPFLYHFVLLKSEDVVELRGNWKMFGSLEYLTEQALVNRMPPDAASVLELERLNIDIQPIAEQEFTLSLNRYFSDKPKSLQALLNTIFVEQPTVIINLPEDEPSRHSFANALMALFPSSLRGIVNYAIRLPSIRDSRIHFRFADLQNKDHSHKHLVYDIETGKLSRSVEMTSTYIDHAIHAWQSGQLQQFHATWETKARNLLLTKHNIVEAFDILERWVTQDESRDLGESQKLALLLDDPTISSDERVAEVKQIYSHNGLSIDLLTIVSNQSELQNIWQELVLDYVKRTDIDIHRKNSIMLWLARYAKQHSDVEEINSFAREVMTTFHDIAIAEGNVDIVRSTLYDENYYELISLDFIQQQIQMLGQHKSDQQHALNLLRHCIYYFSPNKLDQLVNQYPGWIKQTGDQISNLFISESSGDVRQILKSFSLKENDFVLVKLGLILSKRHCLDEYSDLTILSKLLAIASKHDESTYDRLSNAVTWQPDDLFEGASYIIAQIRKQVENDTVINLFLWWDLANREKLNNNSTILKLLKQRLNNVSPATLIGQLIDVDNKIQFEHITKRSFLPYLYDAYFQLEINTSKQRQWTQDFLSITSPDWNNLKKAIEDYISSLPDSYEEDNLTKLVLQWVVTQHQSDVKLRQTMFRWYVSGLISDYQSVSEIQTLNQSFMRVHPIIRHSSDAYNEYFQILKLQLNQFQISITFAEELFTGLNSSLSLERSWAENKVIQLRTDKLIDLLSDKSLTLDILIELAEWQNKPESTQSRLINVLVQQARSNLTKNDYTRVKQQIADLITALDALLPTKSSAEDNSKRSLDRLGGIINRLVKTESSVDEAPFPLLRKLYKTL